MKTLLFLFLWQTVTQAQSHIVQSMTEQQLVAAGRHSYLRHCSGCHGIEADGKGPAAPMLDPKPRNLVEGEFKFRTTETGSLPTVEDLLRTISQGVPQASMPPFNLLSDREKLSLVAYIRSLRPDFKEEVQVSLSLPAPPKPMFYEKAALISAAGKGKTIFEAACLQCHGPTGRGDGPSAATLTDTDNNPIRPADLGKPTIKSGPRATDAYKAITLGLDGTPMPGYASSYTEEQRWQLVAYIFYLRGRRDGTYSERDVLP